MDNKKAKVTNAYLTVLFPLGVVCLGWSCLWIDPKRIDVLLGVLYLLTLFSGSYLRVQLPRTKIHLTLSDTLIYVTFLVYGAHFAVILASLEAFTSSSHFRRKGMAMSNKTLLINIFISALSVGAMAAVVGLFFGGTELTASSSAKEMVLMLGSMAITQFFVNSALVSIFISIRSGESLWHIWNEYCLNALVIYLTGAFMAGLVFTALTQIEPFMIALVMAFFSLVYFTYVRYVNDVQRSSAIAEQAERERAEQAEKHVGELQHYVNELEKTAEALRESRESFRHAAYHDALTGLANRNQFAELLQPYLASDLDPKGKPFSLLFLDLNRFKTINDSLGHSVGDLLIKSVARRLKNAIGDKGVVGRLSGDEFVILIPVGEESEAVAIAEAVYERSSAAYSIDGRQIFTSVSIGIAISSERYRSAEEVLRDADIAMYYAKENGKRVVVFDQIMHARAVSLLELETDLRLAVERNEFEPYYQPLVELADLRLMGFEALARWNHPSRGLVTPGEFITVAESTGLIVPMTMLLLKKACGQAAEWIRNGVAPSELIMSINISPGHFSQGSLVEDIRHVLDETKLDPRCLKLEITESAVMEDAEKAIEVLTEIKAIGVHLSIDDFGTGYSSLSYLHSFPIDTLKVDRSFVKAMESGSGRGEIVETVIALARVLNLSVIAEGIESVDQFEKLRDLGCGFGQGYLFSRPVPKLEAEALIADGFGWKEFNKTVPEYSVIGRIVAFEPAGIQ